MIEATEGERLPKSDVILKAYSLTYTLSVCLSLITCTHVSCGYHPPVVVMDLHKKGVFNMPGM